MLPKTIHPSWVTHLQPLFELPEIVHLKYQILPNITFYPKGEDIFNVFSMPLEDVKVVLLGQDPYPQPNQAIGWSFAIPQSVHKPPSLRIIEEELWNEFPGRGVPFNLDKELRDWKDQGVFLLNTALTVEHGKANSHMSYWKNFIKGVIQILANREKDLPVWLLLGANAKSYIPIIREAETFMPNDIVIAPHPAAEVYAGGSAGFYHSDCFKKVNECLKTWNKPEIDWTRNNYS